MTSTALGFRNTHIGRALARAYWMFRDRFLDAMQTRGFEDLQYSDTEVIPRLPARGGARITELADRARISKQAMSKHVQGLERRGYVRREPDPEDARAQRVFLTRRGLSMLREAGRVVAEIEREWEAVLSPASLERIRREWEAVLSPASLERIRRDLLDLSDRLGPPDYL